ncbi:uncharacterized protein, partial [Penaeus vannamei]|uniref:uncharacterized protein n=1 Tax=Penaeus vannamei TaxID=6689 RepID=UPI00387F5CC9
LTLSTEKRCASGVQQNCQDHSTSEAGLRLGTSPIQHLHLKDLSEALFADDWAQMGHAESDLQHKLDRLTETTKLLHCVEEHSDNGTLDKEIDSRINDASQALGLLGNKVLKQHNIHLTTKLKVYNAVLLLSIFCGSEAWTLCRRHHHVANLEVLYRSNSINIEFLLIRAQLRWVGHVVRMEERLQRHLLCGELATGKCNQGRRKKRFKDYVKVNLQFANLRPN